MSQYIKRNSVVEAVQVKHIEAPGRIVFYGNDVPDWIAEAMAKPEGDDGAIWIAYGEMPSPSNPLGRDRMWMKSRGTTRNIGHGDVLAYEDGTLNLYNEHTFQQTFRPCDPKEDFKGAFSERMAEPYTSPVVDHTAAEMTMTQIIERLKRAKAVKDVSAFDGIVSRLSDEEKDKAAEALWHDAFQGNHRKPTSSPRINPDLIEARRHAIEREAAEEGASRPMVNGISFGRALLALKNGERVARRGWNGKGMFIYHVPAASYPAQTGAAKKHFGDDALIPYTAYLAIKSVNETVTPWLASQTDILADDWFTLSDTF